MKTTVINIWGQPSAGKSTTAAGLFYLMKSDGHLVELVNEFAKELTWSERYNTLQDQLYIVAKQNAKLKRLIGKVEYVITDSPLLLGEVYTPDSYYPSFIPFLRDVWGSYNNLNFLLKRTKPYIKVGRNQSEKEASKIADRIKTCLHVNCGEDKYVVLNGDPSAPHTIYNLIREL